MNSELEELRKVVRIITREGMFWESVISAKIIYMFPQLYCMAFGSIAIPSAFHLYSTFVGKIVF